MANDTAFPWIILIIAPLSMIGFWLFVTRLLAAMSGWSSLADTYRGALSSITASEPMASGRISRFGFPVSYNHVLSVDAGDEGVQLTLFRLLAFGSPPLAIPWSHVADARNNKWLGMIDQFTFRPAQSSVKITLTGRAARMLRDEAARRGHPVQGSA
jgi:hypothetical protein